MGVCYNCSTRVSLWMAEESDLVMPARITRTFGAIAAAGVLGVTGTVGARAALVVGERAGIALADGTLPLMAMEAGAGDRDRDRAGSDLDRLARDAGGGADGSHLART